MPDKRRKTEQELTTLSLLAVMLTGSAFLYTTFGSGSAIAATEQTVTRGPEQLQEISLEGYAPDQSMWAEKMIAKYEKVKDTGEAPLAMLKIERLNVEAPVYFGTKKVTLDRGIGIVEGTANLGEVGNIGISGHRDSFFRPLKDIKLGDKIEMRTAEGIQDFEVTDISIVDALDVSVLDPTDTTVLTLITCHPFYYVGYAPDRYIVRATPVDDNENGDKHNSTQDATISAVSSIQ
jgi:sortase A